MNQLLKAGSLLLAASIATNASAQETIPYSHAFDSADALSSFTVQDRNGDGSTWHYSESDHAIQCSYADFGSANDRLISPMLSLESGKNYQVEYRLRAYNNNGESFGISLINAEGNEVAIAPTENYELPFYNFQPVSKDFTVSTSGSYSISLDYCTQSLFFGGSIFLESMSVKEVEGEVILAIPAAPTLTIDLSNPQPPYEVSIKVKAPKNDTEGNPLSGLKKLDILRDDVVIFSVDYPQLGGTLRTIDSNVPDGQHTYLAVAYSAEGARGEEATEEILLGAKPDAAPAAVTEVFAVYDPATLTSKITWTPVTTDKEGILLQHEVIYSIRRKNENEPIATNYSGTELIDVVSIDNQKNSAYYVTAYNDWARAVRCAPTNSSWASLTNCHSLSLLLMAT